MTPKSKLFDIIINLKCRFQRLVAMKVSALIVSNMFVMEFRVEKCSNSLLFGETKTQERYSDYVFLF